MIPVTIVYLFYRQSTVEPNSIYPTSLVQSFLGMLSSFRGIGARAIRFVSRSDITHVVVGVADDTGLVYCNWNTKSGTQWTSREPRLKPDYIVYEVGYVGDIEIFDTLLPKGEKNHWFNILIWYLTGFPRDTISCSMVVHRTRSLIGQRTKARSPGAIYRELTRQ